MAHRISQIPYEKVKDIYLTPSQAAKVLGIYYTTVIKWIKKGTIKARMDGGRWKIPLTEVLKLINTGEQKVEVEVKQKRKLI